MENSLQNLGRQAIGDIGEEIAKKVIKSCVRTKHISCFSFFKRHGKIKNEIRDFLIKYWYHFDLVKMGCGGVQLIEVKTTTKRYNLHRKKYLSMTPKSKRIYSAAEKLGIKLFFMNIKIPQEWFFCYEFGKLEFGNFSISGGGVNNKKPEWVKKYIKKGYN